MIAAMWIFPLATWFMCVSSNDEQHGGESCGQCLSFYEKHILSSPLGSSVLLPCNFTTHNQSWVSWTNTSGVDLVHLKADGHIIFLVPQRGRVKAFPNEGSKGNFSIRIDELEDSDLGCYCCVQGDSCHQVELVVAADTWREKLWLPIFICVGIVASVLLGVCSHLLYKNRRKNNFSYLVSADTEGADDISFVYENDDQFPAHQEGDPTGNGCRPPRALRELDRTQPNQNTELISRLRQASFTRRYYVNQGEIIRQQQATPSQQVNHGRAVFKKKVNQSQTYNNPIYDRNPERLNNL